MKSVFEGMNNEKKLDAANIERYISINEKKAIQEYADNLSEKIMDKFEFEKQVIRDAKEGNKTAIKYVFYISKITILTIFFTNFLGKKNRSLGFKDKDFLDIWINIAYETLVIGNPYLQSSKEKTTSALEYFDIKFCKKNGRVTPFSSFQIIYKFFLGHSANSYNHKEFLKGISATQGKRRNIPKLDMEHENFYDVEKFQVKDSNQNHIDFENDFIDFFENFKKLTADPEMNTPLLRCLTTGNSALQEILEIGIKKSCDTIGALWEEMEISQTSFSKCLNHIFYCMEKHNIDSSQLVKFTTNKYVTNDHIEKIMCELEEYNPAEVFLASLGKEIKKCETKPKKRGVKPGTIRGPYKKVKIPHCLPKPFYEYLEKETSN